VLRAPALVDRHHVPVTVVLLDGLLKVAEVAAAGVGLVPQHNAGPLVVTHRGGAAVSQQVDVNVRRPEEEGIESSLRDAFLPLLAGSHPDRLHHLDFERLSPGTPPSGFHCLHALSAMLGNRASSGSTALQKVDQGRRGDRATGKTDENRIDRIRKLSTNPVYPFLSCASCLGYPGQVLRSMVAGKTVWRRR
jgi:hypothetical protein